MDDLSIEFIFPKESTKLKTKRKFDLNRSIRAQSIQIESFKCNHCQVHVPTISLLSGVQNRNHCPFCLWSRHLDLARAGDRLAACRSSMQPVGLTVKHTYKKYAGCNPCELMIIHRCTECNKLSINRLAADDDRDAILELFTYSLTVDRSTQAQIQQAGITILEVKDLEIVRNQLFGLN